MQVVLASSSRYRRELLERLRMPFSTDAPDIDESPLADESPAQMVWRLSIAKARAVAKRWPNAIVIGSDQAACCAGRILGKPGSVQQAVKSLKSFAGGSVEFFTGVAVLHSDSDQAQCHVDVTTAHFRPAPEAEIRRYVEQDRPLDCAGGIRFEGLGPLLLDAVHTADPSAAIGLPLIKLGALLRAAGVNPLRDANGS